MSDKTIIFIVFAVIAAIVLAFIICAIMRYLRGSIKISLSQKTFSSGGLIKGSFELNAKKAIPGNRLVASLIGTEVTKTREDGKTKTRSHQIYKDEVVLESNKEYPAGYLETHHFEITVPNMEDASSDLGKAISGA